MPTCLDGISSASFLRCDAADTFGSQLTSANNVAIRFAAANAVDTNDGKIGAGVFSSGLNIVGAQTTAGTGRQVRIWGEVITDGGNKYWHAGNDGSGSGLDADLLDGQSSAYYQPASSALTTSTSFGGDVSGTYNAIVIANDSHTHTFDNLTGKQAGTGDYSTSGDLVAGRGSGSIALTINDGKGNSNVTFNHQNGTPDQNGNAARIEVNTDSSTNASMNFEVKSGVTSGTSTDLTTVLNLAEGVAAVTGNITVTGTVDGRDVASDGSKLDGIESGATADQTASEILTAIKTVDGSGSGLDADLLDAQQGSYYLDYNNFTNTPTIPSLSGYATETYVNTQVSNLVDSAPGTLDTLNELAAALGDDANFSTTVTNSIATKMPLAGGSFTGDVTFGTGADFGSATASSTTDLSRHLALWGTTYGFNVTSNTINLVSAGTNTLSSTSSTLTSKVNHDFSAGIDVTGNITVTGDGFFNGTKLEGDSKEMLRYNDSWLRVNPANEFTSGIYCGSGLLRTDGEFQVGSSGAYFKVTSAGNVTLAGTLDGRDIAADGSKLDGIESGATADQTQSEINALGITAIGLSGTPNISVGTISSGGDVTIPNKIIHIGDTDTYLSFANADDFRIVVGNSTRAAFNTSKIHFNQEGINQDFQVEGNTDTSLLYVDASADNVGIGTASPAHKLEVNGSFAATTKSFDIEHPTKEGMRLHHGVVEGPEHSVYVRGKSKEKVILLPDYWEGLVHEDTITVQLTAIGGEQNLYVEDIKDNKVYVNGENYFYYIQAERKDIERFEVEYEV
jgi:hypothetical protein